MLRVRFLHAVRRSRRLWGLLLWACAVPVAAQAVDHAGAAAITLVDLGIDRAGKTSDVAATVTNTSEGLLLPPIRLVVDSIVPAGVTLRNAAGTTDDGRPFVDVPVPAGGLKPGAHSADVRLKFANPAQLRFSYAVSALLTRAPISDAGGDVTTAVFLPTTIDGGRSYAPNGRRIRFNWTIVASPAGSVATLVASDPAPTLIPDVPGDYVLQLVVTDDEGVRSAPAWMTLRAFSGNAIPNARAGRDRTVREGVPILLDGSRSYDPERGPLGFDWTLASAPSDSQVTQADLLLADTATPLFTPDVAGSYEVLLQVSDGEFVASDKLVITAVDGAPPPSANAGEDRQVDAQGAVALVGAMGPDGDATTGTAGFSWRLVARPAASALESGAIVGADSASASFTPDVDGAYLFRLTVTDGAASDADNVLVRVRRPASIAERKAAAPGASRTAADSASPIPARRRTAAARSPLTLSVSPAVLDLAAGAEGTFDVALGASPESGTTATLDASALPLGFTAAFGTDHLAWGESTKLTIRAPQDAPGGEFSLRVTASGAVGRVPVKRAARVTVRLPRSLVQGEAVSCRGGALPAMAAAVFVSPDGTDSAGCGSSVATACATPQRGIDNCAASGCGVLLRYGRYRTSAPITPRDGVSVFGSCLFGGVPAGNATAANYRTIIEANPPPGIAAISATSINATTTIRGLVVVGKDEQEPGTASVAMAVSDSGGLVLTNSVLVAGRGGDGSKGGSSDGKAGGGGSAPGSSTVGGAGGLACPSAPPTSGGRGGKGADFNEVSLSGCFLACDCHHKNGDASLGGAGESSGSTRGGAGGGRGSSGCNCSDRPHDNPSAGERGRPGAPGACSTTGGTPAKSVWGTLAGTIWKPEVSEQGGSGQVGSGGGGGGSGGFSSNSSSRRKREYSGYPGGGGGGGGCGGPGGQGGQQGGASIALIASNSNVAGIANSNSLVPGPGGTGGEGGVGGIGGPGGSGHAGYEGEQYEYHFLLTCKAEKTPGWGGPGGSGGPGGAGGGGGGGNGGPSIGIAYGAGSPAPATGPGIYPGLPGAGGARGPGGTTADTCTGAPGSAGLAGGSAAVMNLDGAADVLGDVLAQPDRGTVAAAGREGTAPAAQP